MAHRIVERSPGPWSSRFVGLDGDDQQVAFKLHEANVWDTSSGANPKFPNPGQAPTPDMADATPSVSGTVDFTGDVIAEVARRYLGKVDDVFEVQEALNWALNEARRLMIDEGGYVDWTAIASGGSNSPRVGVPVGRVV